MKQISDYIQNARILIVDDEPTNVRLLQFQLEDNGQLNFRATTDSRKALPIFEEFQPDLVLLDLMMPYIDGFGVMEQIHAVLPAESFLPIVVLTADMHPETRKKALSLGAKDFLLKPFDTDELDLRIRNLLEARYLHLRLQEQNRTLEVRVEERTRELESAMKDLRTAQRQAIYQERLHAFATMAGGVAHDFNNSLTIMMGYCDLLLSPGGLDDREDCRRSIGVILQATQDAAKMVQRLRNFYRPKEEGDVHTVIKIADVVRQAVDYAQPKWKNLARGSGSYIVVTTDTPEDLQVRGDDSELREMLVNLMFNAVDAMPNGGHLSLRARGVGLDVVIEVADTGLGMSEEVRHRCLEPFYTTKGERGTGLGLAMVLGIIRRHAGTVDIVSEVGKGTTFAITLPREHEATVVVERGPVQQMPSLRILFADDDAAIRKVVPMCLEKNGHEVTVACDGSEALELYEPGKFDVVLTDLSMPKLSGEKLARAIKDQAAQQPVIVLTGYADMLLRNGPKPSFIDLLINKPITNEALSAALVQMLPEITSCRQLAVRQAVRAYSKAP